MPPLRARNAGWPYDYGYYLPERTATGEEFRWTNQDAVAVIPAGGRNVRLTVWGGHIGSRPSTKAPDAPALEGDDFSWLHPAHADATQGWWQLSEAILRTGGISVAV